MSRANGVPHFTTQDKAALLVMHIAVDDPIVVAPEPSEEQLLREQLAAAEERDNEQTFRLEAFELRLAASRAKEEKTAASLVAAKAWGERWRRRFLWVALPPAVLILTAGWGLLFGWMVGK